MRKWILLLILFLLCQPHQVYASDLLEEQMGDIGLEDVDRQTQDYLEDTDFSHLVKDILKGEVSFSSSDWLKQLGELAFGELAEQRTLLIQLLLVVVLAAILRNVSFSFHGKAVGDMGFYVCYSVLIVVVLSTFFSITDMVTERVHMLRTAFSAMLPVFLALAASSGNLAQTALMGPAMMGGCTIISVVVEKIVVPVVFAAVSLAMVNCLSKKPMTGRLADLLKKVVSWGMRGLAGAFMLLLSLQKIGGSAVNGLAVKTAKIAVNAVPVVGDIMGGAVDTAAAVTGSLRSGILVAAVIFLLLLCLPILIKLVVITVVFYFTAAATESICEERLVQCIGAAGEYTALLLGVVFLAEVMFLFCAVLLLGSL